MAARVGGAVRGAAEGAQGSGAGDEREEPTAPESTTREEAEEGGGPCGRFARKRLC
ncbi:MAG: hypothetical protein ACRDJW_18755 [Thermomicrobiales bacterium]